MKAHRQIRDSGRAEETREKILRAAVREFGRYGLAGARTEGIARAARVNKALIYYYFKNKQGLYAASLEMVSGEVLASALAELKSARSPGERLLRSVLNHFDRILARRDFQSLMQQEMVRLRRGESSMGPWLAASLFRPMLDEIRRTIQEGVEAGELHDLDWMQIVYAALGANVFYFLSAPLMRYALTFEPLSAHAIAARRKAMLEFLGSALFCDRTQGARLARLILARAPMPAFKTWKGSSS